MNPRTVREIRDRVHSGDSAEDIARSCLDHIEERDGEFGCFLSVDREGALAAARDVDRRRASGETLGSLAGVPIAIKDNICTKGLRTTCGSRMLEDYVPPYDAHVIERLRQADAVIVGKTNMDEFAMGSSTENSALLVTRNPWDLSRSPGGSSGGSAAAVAAGLVPVALGSDTGGSVRQPGAFCGVPAIKPTYGCVSRYGLVAFASSLDQVGSFGATVEDAALLLSAIAGHDVRDATSVPRPSNTLPDRLGSLEGVRVGVPRSLVGDTSDEDVVGAFDRVETLLRESGAIAVDVDLPHAEHAVAVYYLVATAEASSNLSRFDGVRYGHRASSKDLETMYSMTRDEGFGDEVKRRIMLGTYALSAGYYDAFYLKAQRVRTLIRRDFAAAFDRCDVIMTPTTPTPAFGLGEKVEDPLSMYLADIFTVPANLAGIPAISIPVAVSGEGLPIGLQFMAPAFEEATLVGLAQAVESRVDFPPCPGAARLAR
ncbi:MAG: Asp-tRNA(Asn)/Glu-tRNA(Gln) amidotransferase subunit GatA [Myxococcales bacterium]|nr:Asp-tRNA(Asn)/Glu-tRNA(Gln) amidotransferase subunit GatA [Myxococcales bacterium]